MGILVGGAKVTEKVVGATTKAGYKVSRKHPTIAVGVAGAELALWNTL